MDLTVKTTSPTASVASLHIGGKTYPCTLGRAGVIDAALKTEGDGKTPLGTYPLRYLLYRADRVAKPDTALTAKILTPATGWCEDQSHADYNREIVLPHDAVNDVMTRDDHLYDYVTVIGYNDDPVVAGKGSAIFMHLARPDFTPTAGCVGLKEADLIEVLKFCTPDSRITILPPE